MSKPRREELKCQRPIADDDNLFRHATRPEAFDKNGKRFAFRKLFLFRSSPEEPEGPVYGSLVWERYAPTEYYVHRAGCRNISRSNERRLRDGKKEKRVYCGAYQLTAASIRSVASEQLLPEIASADVYHKIEEGEIAHAEVKIAIQRSPSLDIETTKTAVVAHLLNQLRGPLIHVCEEDAHLSPHPSVDLKSPLNGAYFDKRSRLRRFASIVRYKICLWFWRRISPELGTS